MPGSHALASRYSKTYGGLMPGQSNWDGQLENRVADQVDRIVAAFHAVDVNIGVVPAKDGKVEYMYA
jgi:hypothetical protein